MTRARAGRVLAVVGLLAAMSVGPLGTVDAVAAQSSGGFSTTRTVTRTNLAADGTVQVVNTKTIRVTVDETKSLHGRQDINVSWTGAQPTGGVQPDLNSVLADQEEYPMVLLECRGTDSATAPVAKRVSPETCWTHGSDERYQAVAYTQWAPWRLDSFATTADRAAVVGRPSNVPAACGGAPASEMWTPFEAIDGKKYYYGNQSCAGIPPEDFNFDTSQQIVPENATFAPTAADGSGSAKFDVWTDAENASLGCNQKVACTLEVIPIMGLSCDPYGVSKAAAGLPAEDIPSATDLPRATSLCEATGQYTPGESANPTKSVDLAASGALWWSASNWRNRIAVPLSFAPVSQACQTVSAGAPVSVYGSELMTEAMTQWTPRFCLDPKLFKLTHVQTAEPLARTLLNDPTSGVDASFTMRPPDGGFARPTVQAPVGVTGFAISYTIDDSKGNAVTSLRLTPRLLAKLLTESYPEDDFNRFKTGQFPYLAGNPVNVTDDPEFQALNPGITTPNGYPGAASLITLSAESDVTWALTDYINADPEARAWLNGAPDPWGMKVNPAYKGIKLPLLRWPILDTTLPDFADQVACTRVDPAPWLPLVASPTPALATTTLDVQFAAPTGKINCTLTGDIATGFYQWGTIGREAPGRRFVIGVTSLAEASRYDLQTAALQTSATNSGAQFTDDTGRTFVAWNATSLAAAVSHVAWSASAHQWQLTASAINKDPAAYPGTMIINADVPTTGLSHDLARDYSQFLTFAAGAGQVVGTGNGQLPGGYLPMTSANGLGKLVDYTSRAAADVAKQDGVVTPRVAPPASPPSSAGASGGSGNTPPPTTGNTSVPTTGGSSTPPSAGKHSSGGSSSPSASPAAQHVSIPTASTHMGAAGLILPVLLGVGVLGGLAAGGSTVRPRRAR